jgi:glutamate-1-semialdehyde 2,1-aminomutase
MSRQDTTRSQAHFAEAQKLMPGGVSSPVRAFRAVGGTPRVISAARGCQLTDVDGNTYIDYLGAWGPMILGHAHPTVVEAIAAAGARGAAFGTSVPDELELARLIGSRMPSLEMVRFVNSGTEAVMSAIRLARAVTGRRTIIKFAGCYHGHADSFLVQAGSGVATLGLPDSPGVPAEATRFTHSATYNDLDSVGSCFATAGDDVAAVVVEPVAGNMGVVPPAAGFLEGLRDLTRKHGALLIFDEVMTGFRVAPGGAQERFGVHPDLTTLGKVIGGGLPVGAYGGSRQLMMQVAPQGSVYQAGTMSGNPVVMAAGAATLAALDGSSYAMLEQRASRLAVGLETALARAGITGCVQRVGSMLTLFFGVERVTNFAEAQSADHQQFARFFHGMLERGVHLPPSGYEAWFVSLAHDEAAIEHTLTAAKTVLDELGAAG